MPPGQSIVYTLLRNSSVGTLSFKLNTIVWSLSGWNSTGDHRVSVFTNTTRRPPPLLHPVPYRAHQKLYPNRNMCSANMAHPPSVSYKQYTYILTYLLYFTYLGYVTYFTYLIYLITLLTYFTYLLYLLNLLT